MGVYHVSVDNNRDAVQVKFATKKRFDDWDLEVFFLAEARPRSNRLGRGPKTKLHRIDDGNWD